MAGAAPSVIIHPGRHVVWYGDDTQRERAMAILLLCWDHGVNAEVYIFRKAFLFLPSLTLIFLSQNGHGKTGMKIDFRWRQWELLPRL